MFDKTTRSVDATASRQGQPKPSTISFLLIDGFSATCVFSAIDTLRTANALLGYEAYRWNLLSHDGAAVHSASGIALEVDCDLDTGTLTDFLFVCAGLIHDPPYRQRLHAVLKQFDRNGVKLGAFSVGAFILARAGLLDGCKCTVQRELEPAFREEFPEIEFRPTLFVVDQNRFTCCGGIAGIDLMLRIVGDRHSEEICIEIANRLHLDRVRTEEDIQHSGSTTRISAMPGAIQAAVRLMLENVEEPLSNARIAGRVNTSVRNLERIFRRELGSSPAKYYLSLRLEKAREFLLHTNVSTLEIAIQTGFASSSYFARCFFREFGKRPSDVRKPAKSLEFVR
jgi:AraC family transcriptional regulator, glycine betaine-responsive activator